MKVKFVQYSGSFSGYYQPNHPFEDLLNKNLEKLVLGGNVIHSIQYSTMQLGDCKFSATILYDEVPTRKLITEKEKK